MARDPKDNALKLAMTSIERQFSKGACALAMSRRRSIFRRSAPAASVSMKRSRGGPRRAITEIYGPRVR